MTPHHNQQHLLAKQFHDEEVLIIKANHEAFLNIKRWKYINGLSYLNTSMKDEADTMIHNSLFTYINNTEILTLQGYFKTELQN
jgi:hypothetical protein